MDAPGPISPTETTKLETPRGALYAEIFRPREAPRGVVLITHGYAEHCGRYHEVAHVIVNAGWAALAYDVRGHGHSPGERGYVDHFETYLDDFKIALAAAKKLAPNAPVILLGHSHGGLITLRALCDEQPPQADAAVISSPFLKLRMQVPAYKKLLARVASRVAPKLAQPSALRVEDLTADKQKQAERIADKLCFEIATARWYTEANEAQAYVERNANRIKVPTTWLVGGADPITDPSQSRRIAGRIDGAQYHDLAGLKHEVFNEVERGKVFGELAKVLTACNAARS